MSGNRILFMVVLAILGLLVAAMLVLSTGSAEGAELLAALVRTLIGVGVLVLSVRLLRNIAGRRR